MDFTVVRNQTSGAKVGSNRNASFCRRRASPKRLFAARSQGMVPLDG